NYTIQYLRERSFLTSNGVSLLGISDAAESLGYRTNGVRATLEQLVTHVKMPCILHWNHDHFVVCYRIRRKKKNDDYDIYISDPAGEKYVMNKSEFLKCWTGQTTDPDRKGIVLILEPTPAFYQQPQEKSKEKSLAYYFNYLKPYRKEILQLILGMLTGSLLALFLPFLTQAMVDQGINSKNLNFVTLVLIAQIILSATQLGVSFIQNWIALQVNSRISISLISDFLAKLMRLPLRFFDAKNVGDIMQRIRDNGRIRSFLTGSTLTTLFSFANFIIFACLLAWYNSTILVIFLVGNTLYIGWILLFLKYRRKLDLLRFTQSAAEQSNLVQIISGMQEIKLNNCEKEQRWHWERIQVKLFRISMKGLTIGQYQQVGSVFLSQTTSLLISFLAARSVIEGHMTLGMMMSVSYIIGQLSGPIGQLIGLVQDIQDAKISLERLNEIHNQPDEEQEHTNKADKVPVGEPIRFCDLSFSYDGAQRNFVLDRINLEIPPRKVTAIVGASGSGKTTLIKLMLGFYPPLQGDIRIGNTSLSHIHSRLWREHTGAVMQDGYIFSDTILSNIVIHHNQVDTQRLRQAVDIANIGGFIDSLALRYQTKIGMEGDGLSQGQKQRLLIARAVYKNPDFLFFDEATNALDANNEKEILNKLHNFYKGKTVVIVAHRLSTVQRADHIVVMDKGRICEQGSHAELVDRRGAYYTLIRNQLELGQ
ncbi:MAG: peptidase domain-containing ABC transporter, partial [Bacteroides sp.]|nr:peptidase domain-containing ABC transporter [Bacteroides sp.]